MEGAKLAYFELLINNAGKDTKLDPEVLNRIERLVGIPAAPEKPAGDGIEDRNTDELTAPADPQ